MTTSAKVYVYKDPLILRTSLLVLLGLLTLVVVSRIGVLSLLGEASSYTGEKETFTSAQAARWSLDIGVLAYFPTFVVGAFWIAQASRNAHSFGRRMEYSVGGSVGWYFVPFANLVKPLLAMDEIWNCSAPGEQYKTRLLPIWWGSWVVSNIASNIALRLPIPSGVEIFVSLLELASLATFATLVVRLSRMQRQTAQTAMFSEGEETPIVSLQAI